MKALVSHAPGRLALSDLPTPVPGPGEVLLRVRAVALNPLDVKLLDGEMQDMLPITYPFVPGMDAAGAVAAVGAGVSRFALGDEVVAFAPPPTAGALAEYVVVADGPCIAHRPPDLDAVRGAAVPVAAMIATALLEAAQPQPGQSVLIVGATGGVGSFLVQLAAQSGAEVLATAGPADADLVRSLGATHAIDYTSADTVQEALRIRPLGVDLAIDLVTPAPAPTAFTDAAPAAGPIAAAVLPGGRVLSPLYGPAELDRGISLAYVGIEGGLERLQDLVDRAATGRLAVEIGGVYPFAAAERAMAEFVGKHTRGKIIITL